MSDKLTWANMVEVRVVPEGVQIVWDPDVKTEPLIVPIPEGWQVKETGEVAVGDRLFSVFNMAFDPYEDADSGSIDRPVGDYYCAITPSKKEPADA